MKLSRAETAALCIAGAFLLFFGGWFLRGTSSAKGTYVITAQRTEASPTPAPARETFLPDALLDLNTATQADLEALPGVGASRSRAILQWRAENGPFTYPEQLTEVPGIGQTIYDGLAPYITVKEADPT